MIYEVVRHHVRPPAEPICEGCQQDLPKLTIATGLPTGENAFDLSGQNSVACSPLSPPWSIVELDACFVAEPGLLRGRVRPSIDGQAPHP